MDRIQYRTRFRLVNSHRYSIIILIKRIEAYLVKHIAFQLLLVLGTTQNMTSTFVSSMDVPGRDAQSQSPAFGLLRILTFQFTHAPCYWILSLVCHVMLFLSVSSASVMQFLTFFIILFIALFCSFTFHNHCCGLL